MVPESKNQSKFSFLLLQIAIGSDAQDFSWSQTQNSSVVKKCNTILWQISYRKKCWRPKTRSSFPISFKNRNGSNFFSMSPDQADQEASEPILFQFYLHWTNDFFFVLFLSVEVSKNWIIHSFLNSYSKGHDWLWSENSLICIRNKWGLLF